MKADELRRLTDSELTDKLTEAKAEIFNLRFQVATNQIDNTARVGTVKREVARLLTVIRAREIERWNESIEESS